MPTRNNPFGKSRTVNDPYAVFKNGDWEWRVLKTYQRPDKEADNPHARWFCAVSSPMTFNTWEYGDTYVRGVIMLSELSFATADWMKAYHGDDGGPYGKDVNHD